MKPFPGAVEALSEILAVLRAQSMLYQTAHWQSRGSNFYGDHLLFERLYNSVQGEIDAIAEKIVGYFGPSGVDVFYQIERVEDWVEKQEGPTDVLTTLLCLEEDFQLLLKNTYDLFKSNQMPLGLDDWLMATASAHDTNMYLLQQSGGEGYKKKDPKLAKLHNINHPLTAEEYFYKTPRKREVREFAETGAPSNEVNVGENILDIHGDSDVERLVDKTPLTPEEIVKRPGGKAISTLNRLVVDSEDKGVKPAVRANKPLMPKEAFSMEDWLRWL